MFEIFDVLTDEVIARAESREELAEQAGSISSTLWFLYDVTWPELEGESIPLRQFLEA